MSSSDILIVTGVSGSGKSTVLNVLEDIGYYCVDNLPVVLFLKFLKLGAKATGYLDKIAIGMDVRERGFFKEYPRIFKKLKDAGYNFELIFLDCSDEVLVRRFSETRRAHPLSEDGPVIESILKEREMMAGLKTISSKTIDTTRTNVHQLKKIIQDIYSEHSLDDTMKITIVSFGYKNSVPNFADLIFDVRFLVNPYFIPELKSLNGLDKKIQDFLFKKDDMAKKFIKKLNNFIKFLIPLYEKEGKRYLTIAVGCTGGQHRSVAVVDKLKSLLSKHFDGIIVSHRDMQLKNEDL